MITRAELQSVRDDLRLDMFRFVGNARRSIVADVAAHRFLVDRLRPTAWIPAAGGWAISYEALAGMVDHVLSQDRSTSVVEAGSGVSTIWLGYALREFGAGGLTAFEHDPAYARRTRRQIEAHGLEEWCSVVDAPLRPALGVGPEEWYDLRDWARHEIDLLLIDGPPGAGGPLARLPAFAALKPHLTDGALVVVDDIDRSDERAMVAEWMADNSAGQLSFLADHGASRFLRFTRNV